jgi:hypothetical protein
MNLQFCPFRTEFGGKNDASFSLIGRFRRTTERNAFLEHHEEDILFTANKVTKLVHFEDSILILKSVPFESSFFKNNKAEIN